MSVLPPVPSTLDRRSEYSVRAPLRECVAVTALDDGTPIQCEGKLGHEGPHHARVTRCWETVSEVTGG